MKKETEGLILKEQTVGDKDRLVTVLTKDRGVLRCFVRGAKNMKNSSFARRYVRRAYSLRACRC